MPEISFGSFAQGFSPERLGSRFKRSLCLFLFANLSCVWIAPISFANTKKSDDSDRCLSALRVVLQNRIVSAFDKDHIKKLSSLSEKQLMDIYPTYSVDDIKQLKQVLDTPRLIELRRMQAVDYVNAMKLDHHDLISKMDAAFKLQREQIARELELTKTLKGFGIIGEQRIPEEQFHKILEAKIEKFLPSAALMKFTKDPEDLFEALHMHMGMASFRGWINSDAGAVEAAIAKLPVLRRQGAMDFIASLNHTNYHQALAYVTSGNSMESAVVGGLDLIDNFYKLKIEGRMRAKSIADKMISELGKVQESWLVSPHYVSHPSKEIQKAVPYILFLRRQIRWIPLVELRYFYYLFQFDMIADPPKELLTYVKKLDELRELARKSVDDEYVRGLLTLKGERQLRGGGAYQMLLQSYRKVGETAVAIGSALGLHRPVAD